MLTIDQVLLKKQLIQLKRVKLNRVGIVSKFGSEESENAAKKVAKKFITFLSNNNYQKKIGAKESFFVLVNKLFPKLPDIAIGKQLKTIKKYLNQ